MNSVREALAAGYHCLSAWADLLDRINVFPVADGDTGANLRISLAPLRNPAMDQARTRELIARCAIGNSGNIAAAFFQEYCRAEQFAALPTYARQGSDKARQALAAPRAGTMLDIFACLARTLDSRPQPPDLYGVLCREMEEAVLATATMLPQLREAGVVDSGALGMYIFFEGFFRQLAGLTTQPAVIPKLFAGKLSISAAFHAEPTGSYCVNVVLQPGEGAGAGDLAQLGDSVVVLPAESGLKVHIHTADRQELRERLSSLGEIVQWADEVMDTGAGTRPADPDQKQVVHIMTDAAGSIDRETARQNSITLLDSYIQAGDNSCPESLCPPAEVYALLRQGSKVSTAQAPDFERYQYYRSVCQRFGRTLYLCVGSVFTGNFATAVRWQQENDPDNLLTIIDTGAASGRLGLIALLTARYARQAVDPEYVVAFAQQVLLDCVEYVFIDQLRYLVAGGRVSRTGGKFADLLHLKPVISPTSAGVRKEGVVRSREGQLSFALDRLRKSFSPAAAPVIMLQFSDNEEWVAQKVLAQVRALLPQAEILFVPLSLTSGVHMGPGTWAMAWSGCTK
ncbi:MAG: DegV family protein [Desulfobulbaceae bacterium]